MQTVNLEIATKKVHKLTEFLKGLSHFGDDGMAAYHAAYAVRNGNLRCGIDRRLNAIRKATKAFNVMVSVANNPRGIPTVRLYSPIKQIEIYL